jgi:hypothetical protein
MPNNGVQFCFNLVTFVSYLALLHLPAVFFYKNILQRHAGTHIRERLEYHRGHGGKAKEFPYSIEALDFHFVP